MKRLFFEEPLTIYIVLAVATAVVALVWRVRRTRRWALAILVGPVLAVAMGLTAYFVETDLEQINSALETIGVAIEASDIDAAAVYADPACVAPVPGGGTIGRDMLIEIGRRTLRHWPVSRLLLSEAEIQIDGDAATTRVRTRVISQNREYIDIVWRLEWAERDTGWWIVRVEIVSPAALADWDF